MLEVYAHFPGRRKRYRCGRSMLPRWSAAADFEPVSLPCVGYLAAATVEEKRGVPRTIPGPICSFPCRGLGGTDDDHAVTELSVRALCSNRHLTEHLPIGIGGADFRLIDDFTLNWYAWRDRHRLASRSWRSFAAAAKRSILGAVTWRLVNMLSTNHLGLVGAGCRSQRAGATRNAVDVCRHEMTSSRSAGSAASAASTAGRSCAASASARALERREEPRSL